MNMHNFKILLALFMLLKFSLCQDIENEPAPCTVKNKTYKNGDDFTTGCDSRHGEICHCKNGSISCVSMCPPSPVVSFEKNGQMYFCDHKIRVPEKCCEILTCDDDDTNNCQSRETSSGKINLISQKYPWSVLYCTTPDCKQFYGGVIVGWSHILTLAPDLSNVAQLFLVSNDANDIRPVAKADDNYTISNYSVHPDFINDQVSRLQLIKFQDDIPFSKTLRPGNLPFTKDHCINLSKKGCPFTAVGWNEVIRNGVGLWSLQADEAINKQEQCEPTASDNDHIKNGSKKFCVSGLKRKSCAGPLGGAILSSTSKADIIVAIPDVAASSSCGDHPENIYVLPMCDYVDWIQTLLADD